MPWFHRMELLARLGVIEAIPALRAQARWLASRLEAAAGYLTRALRHRYFGLWGAYTGLMLERDWRTQQRRVNDLTFRSLLILHYAGLQTS